jgi:hypothetical protein
MDNPAAILVIFVILVCGYTAFSFFQRAFEVNAMKAKSKTRELVKAVRFRSNLIFGVIMAFITISGLVWLVENW